MRSRRTDGRLSSEIGSSLEALENDPPLQHYDSDDDSDYSWEQSAAHDDGDDQGKLSKFFSSAPFAEHVAPQPQSAPVNPFLKNLYCDEDDTDAVPPTSPGAVSKSCALKKISEQDGLPSEPPPDDIPVVGEVSGVPPTPDRPERAPMRQMIDNTALLYLPLRLRCGVMTMCRPEVLGRCPEVLDDLNGDLMQCLRFAAQVCAWTSPTHESMGQCILQIWAH